MEKLAYNIKDSGVRFFLPLDKEDIIRALPYTFGFADSKFGEIVYHRTYSRVKPDGTQENWYDTVIRAINGLFTIRKWWFTTHNLPWNENAASERALEMAISMLQMKWLPPGRGLWIMGTDYLYERGGMALYNCAFVEIRDLVKDICWLMDALMCGCGVGFGISDTPQDLSPRTKGKATFVIPDSREGWVESVRLLLLSYLQSDNNYDWGFDYSAIRPYGALIKGFGGIASGPDPLVQLHKEVRKYCEAYIKKNINWTHLVANLANCTGICVVVGNVRRSAEICLGNPNDETFIDLKNYEKYPERQAFGWMSNNSCRLRQKNDFLRLDDIAKRILTNGEPGIYNAINVQRFARYGDEAFGPDRAIGLNPCFPSSQRLLTKNGYVTFGDLYKKAIPVFVITDNRISYTPSADNLEHTTNWRIDTSLKGTSVRRASKVYLTQKNAKLLEVSTKLGFSIICTEDHHIATKNGMIAAKYLSEKDEILIPVPKCTTGIRWEFPQTPQEMLASLVGFIQGDGTCDSRGRVHLDFWGEDRFRMTSLITKWIDTLCDLYPKVSVGSSPLSKWYVIESKNKIRISSQWLGMILKDFGFSFENKMYIPNFIMNFSSTTIGKFYLAALFYCDGSVQGNSSSGFTVRLHQSEESFLRNIQLILQSNGMVFGIYKRRNEHEKGFPDGKGGTKIYKCKSQFELISSQGSFVKYKDVIGFFGLKNKEERLDVIHNFRESSTVISRVTIIKDAGYGDVYCLQEPITRSIIVEGCSVRRCGEIPLESYELCNLSEVFPTRCSSRKEFLNAVSDATFYSSTVSLYPTHSPDTNAVIARNRRIGVSLSGIAEWIDTWGAPRITRWIKDGYHLVRETNKKVNEEAGVPPSIRVTTVKPSGSISQLAGVPSGMHYPTFRHAIRRIIIDNGNPMTKLLQDAGYFWEPVVEFLAPNNAESREEFPKYRSFVKGKQQAYKSLTSIVFECPIYLGTARPAREVSPWEQFTLLAMLQREWADNSVSCTVYFDPEKDGHQISHMLSAFVPVIKSVSMLPHSDNGSYPQMPYQGISEEEFKESVKNIRPVDWSLLNGHIGDVTLEMYCQSDKCELKY